MGLVFGVHTTTKLSQPLQNLVEADVQRFGSMFPCSSQSEFGVVHRPSAVGDFLVQASHGLLHRSDAAIDLFLVSLVLAPGKKHRKDRRAQSHQRNKPDDQEAEKGRTR